MSTAQANAAQGKIVQCIGAVVDIQFPANAMPKVYDALVLDASAEHPLVEKGLTFEVQQQIGDGRCPYDCHGFF